MQYVTPLESDRLYLSLPGTDGITRDITITGATASRLLDELEEGIQPDTMRDHEYYVLQGLAEQMVKEAPGGSFERVEVRCEPVSEVDSRPFELHITYGNGDFSMLESMSFDIAEAYLVASRDTVRLLTGSKREGE